MAKPKPVPAASSPAAGEAEDASPAAGLLSVVATPLGNLEDISVRALRVLRECDLIAAEDTRVTRKLLAHFDIHTPLTAHHAHNEVSKASQLLGRLQAGAHVALVSDAGTPGISDPGGELIARAVGGGVRVEPIPGPSALLAVLVASGLPCARFVFEGFLPRTKSDRRERIELAAQETRAVVFYEAPSRLVATLDDLVRETGPERRAVVGREITKKFEEFRRGTLAGVADYFRANPPRGECTLVLEGASDAAATTDDAPDPEALLLAALAGGTSPRDAVRRVAELTGVPRNDLYALTLRASSSRSAKLPPPASLPPNPPILGGEESV